MPNRFNRIAPGSSSDDIIRMVNENFGKIDNESVTKAFSGPSGTNSLVQGRLPNDLGYGTILYGTDGNAKIYMSVESDGDPVLKVAKTGYDATTAADANLIFNSAQNVFKIVQKGEVTFAGGGASSTNVSVTHNLGYQPLVFGFISFSPTGTRYPLPYFEPNTSVDPSPGTMKYQISMEAVNNNTVTFFYRPLQSTSTSTYYIAYYIMQETAT